MNLSKKRKKPIEIGPPLSLLFIPIMFVVAALSIPFTAIAMHLQSRRENRFKDSMKAAGRSMEWTDLMRELEGCRGTFIVERFSFKGPVRLWWTRENVYDMCSFPLVDWLTMINDVKFDEAREWFCTRYTGAKGQALLVLCNKEQRHSLRGADPMSFRCDLQWVEVPPAQKVR